MRGVGLEAGYKRGLGFRVQNLGPIVWDSGRRVPNLWDWPNEGIWQGSGSGK